MNRTTSLLAVALVLGMGSAMAAGPQSGAAKPAAAPMDHSKMNMAGPKMQGMDMAAPPSGDRDFGTLDKNSDGKLAKAEFPANHPLVPHFGMADANRDGTLSQQEFAAGLKMIGK